MHTLNLLPLMYRGKTSVVIGDKEQLPAIPTVRSSEELILARKFGVEEYLEVIGHADNDVYSAACAALPRQRTDVLWLEEHYRSNPQIIGFSNRFIYQGRLELKKALTPTDSYLSPVEFTRFRSEEKPNRDLTAAVG